METRPGGRWLTNLTPWSWERCWSTFREGKGDDFSLRKAFFVRLWWLETGGGLGLCTRSKSGEEARWEGTYMQGRHQD